MGLFDFFKRKNPIQEYLDSFVKNIEIIDVVAATDIPIATFNGSEQRRVPADIFFKGASRIPPHRIDSFIKDSDVVFWIFDTFFVLELNAKKDDNRQFVVIGLKTTQHGHDEKDPLMDRLDAMESSIKILGLKEQLRNPVMEVAMFKEIWDFFVKHHDEAISLLQRKYY